MQEEISKKTIAITVKASKFTLGVFLKAVKSHLNKRKAKKTPTIKGKKMSVKKLVKKYDGLKTADIEEENQIKDFEKIARKYNLQYALKKDPKTNPPSYVVFFKGRDADVIDKALLEFTQKKTKKKDKPSLMEKMKQFKEKSKQLDIGKDKHKAKEQSL